MPPGATASTSRDLSFSLGQLRSLWAYVAWVLADKRRWMLVVPALSVLGAIGELTLLAGLVNTLLSLVDGRENVDTGLGPFSADMSRSTVVTIAAVAGVASIGIRVAESMVVGRLSARATAHARRWVIESFFEADWRAVATVRTGHLQRLLGTNAQMVSQTVPNLGGILTNCVNLALFGVFIAAASPVVGALFGAVGVATVSLTATLRRRLKRTAGAVADHVRDVELAATTLTSLHRELQIFDVQRDAKAELLALNASVRRPLTRIRTLQRLLPAFFQQVILLNILGVVALAAVLDVNATSFGTAAVLAVRSLGYLQQLNATMQTDLEGRPFREELQQAVVEHRAQARRRGSRQLDRISSLEVVDVGFSYDEHPVLREVSFRLEPGDWIGIEGPSGSGKTTLLNVLAGLLEPTTGAYLVDGEPAHSWSAESWALRFALLSQDPVLLRGTVADNIAFYRPASREAIVAAARAAAVEDDVLSLPNGFDTFIGEGAAGLSGGQLQRLALARALLQKPQVLLLDEPTSALDTHNEQLVEQSLVNLDPATIVIIVSHRPRLLERCPRVIAVRDGRVTGVREGAAGRVQ